MEKIAREVGRERGGGACKHFVKKLVPVYQEILTSKNQLTQRCQKWAEEGR